MSDKSGYMIVKHISSRELNKMAYAENDGIHLAPAVYCSVTVHNLYFLSNGYLPIFENTSVSLTEF